MGFNSSCRLFVPRVIMLEIVIEIVSSMLTKCISRFANGGMSMVKRVGISVVGILLIVAVVDI
jgi:hypothetical protein